MGKALARSKQTKASIQAGPWQLECNPCEEQWFGQSVELCAWEHIGTARIYSFVPAVFGAQDDRFVYIASKTINNT